ncbi:sigma-70 family RNA polymerase sigma factor [Mucilaginibacter sp. SMC90]|uniref:RNA polymerase sigma factor n=1 Tax=Mucilaginibacter sp. SMC90 TaxID=2929803 RepID=UPI001FB472E0|nr:sigma-70 family RNA polymerase sigma factor [Mucilaginibacter sp. SMC90]UOE49983.1 sigma-70 family RNA polymerase sigma factor [Mucilaginibacter sp. SMC90]
MSTKESHFMQLINQNKGILFKICRIYMDDPADRDDLLQEMTLQLWRGFDSFKGESKFSSWMYRVALNTAIVFFKKQKRRPDSEQMPAGFEHPEEQSNAGEKEEQLAMFYRAVQQLGKVEKALIFLYMENQSSEEIAASLGITPINVRVRLNRVKTKLKDIVNTLSYEH